MQLHVGALLLGVCLGFGASSGRQRQQVAGVGQRMPVQKQLLCTAAWRSGKHCCRSACNKGTCRETYVGSTVSSAP
jgi:hypothetical protein